MTHMYFSAGTEGRISYGHLVRTSLWSFEWVLCYLTRATSCSVSFYVFPVLSFGCSCYVVSSSASDWLERLVSEITHILLMGHKTTLLTD